MHNTSQTMINFFIFMFELLLLVHFIIFDLLCFSFILLFLIFIDSILCYLSALIYLYIQCVLYKKYFKKNQKFKSLV